MLGEITLTGLTAQGASSSQFHNWRVGQMLEAVALSRPAADRLRLRIGGAELEARTQAPIQAGDKVLLRVLSVGNTPTLQVVPATVAAANAADIVNHTLRQLLPRQLPTERVLNNLVDILSNQQQRSQLPPQTRSLIETLLGRIPRGERLADHSRLRQLVAESGVFRELNQRGQAGNQVGNSVDIKQALVQLARQLAAARPSQTAEGGRPQLGAGQPASGSSVASGSATTVTSVTSAQPPVPGATQTGVAQSVNATPATQQAAANAVPSTGAGEPRQSTSPQASTAPHQAQLQRQPHAAQRPLVVPEGAVREERSVQAFTSQNHLLQDVQRLVDGAIARIVLQQAQSMPQPQQEGVRWVFELPYRQGDEYHSLPMVIEREASSDDSEQLDAGWQVELSFELPELGLIEARIWVRGEKVSASLWAERDSTAKLADTEMPVLETALEACGLEVGALVCRQGKQAESGADKGGSPLLDFHV